MLGAQTIERLASSIFVSRTCSGAEKTFKNSSSLTPNKLKNKQTSQPYLQKSNQIGERRPVHRRQPLQQAGGPRRRVGRLQGLEVQLGGNDRLPQLPKVQLQRAGNHVQVVGVGQLADAVDALI